MQTLVDIKLLTVKHFQPEDYYKALLAGRAYREQLPICEDGADEVFSVSLVPAATLRRAGKFRLVESFQWGCVSFLFKPAQRFDVKWRAHRCRQVVGRPQRDMTVV